MVKQLLKQNYPNMDSVSKQKQILFMHFEKAKLQNLVGKLFRLFKNKLNMTSEQFRKTNSFNWEYTKILEEVKWMYLK